MNDNKIVEDWMKQVACLVKAGLTDEQARGVIAILSKNGWLLYHTGEVVMTASQADDFVARSCEMLNDYLKAKIRELNT